MAPSFNVGGQFDPNNNGIPVAPVVGTGKNLIFQNLIKNILKNHSKFIFYFFRPEYWR